tara:strand:+ start:888 stop:2282 length:1395 start_codon:yes stop_codon:yes gene_type:complete
MVLLSQTQQSYYNDPNSYGRYQLVALSDIINQFIIGYVGDDKVISKIKRNDVQFYAMRAIQELSFDTLVSKNAFEMTVPASLTMPLPQDYVNYTKISWSDDSGIKHRIYPTNCNTGDPDRYQQDSDGDFLFDLSGNLIKTGDMLDDGSTTLEGGPGDWELNVKIGSGNPNNTFQAPSSSQALSTGVGWFWDNNKIYGFNLPFNQGIRVANVPIYSGEKYKLTFTLSDYAQGRFEWIIRDENGDTYTPVGGSTQYTANGTYTEIIDFTAANTTADNKEAQVIGFKPAHQGTSGAGCNVTIDNISLYHFDDEESSKTWGNYKSTTPSANVNDDYEDDVYWPYQGERYGLDPSHAQTNGSFFINYKDGKIHFSSNLSGKTIVLDYVSDGLAEDYNGEIYIHKFAEEAMYKWIAYSIMSVRSGVPETVIRRFKKEKFAETRKAKLRLSNIKLAEISQVLRGKSKQIKH